MFIRHPIDSGFAFDGKKVYGLYYAIECMQGEVRFVDKDGFAFDDQEFTKPSCCAVARNEIKSVEEFLKTDPVYFEF